MPIKSDAPRPGMRTPKGRPTINHVRVLRSIARNQRSGAMYAPVGASYKRAIDLVNFGLALPTHGCASAGLQYFSVTPAGRELLIFLDKVVTDRDMQRYWLREKPQP